MSLTLGETRPTGRALLGALLALALVPSGLGAQSWTAQTSGTTSDLTAVHFPVDATTGYAVGNAGTILKTTNGGTSWTSQTSGTTNELLGVHFPVDAMTGYVAGKSGTIRKTTNGGATWTAVASGTAENLHDVHFVDALTGWVVGRSGLIRKTTDGGGNWDDQTSSTAQDLNDVHFPVDALTGYAVGNGGAIVKTTNGGTSWVLQGSGTANRLFGVHFLSPTVGYVVGASGTILKTTNGGSTWTPQTSGTADDLRGVHFPMDAVRGYAVGKNGRILRTTDGGLSWSNETSGTINELTAVHFPSDAETGWAVGQAGTILKRSPPPTISSAANQTIPVGDPPRAISTITVTESATPSITAGNDIRIRVPAGLNMTWDTADLTAVIGGAAAGKVSSTVSYEDGGKTLVLDVTSNFVAGDQITVSGLSFANFTATSGPARLELEVKNDDVVTATDDKTITIIAAGVPRISSEFDQSFRVGDAPTTISTITVTDDPVTRSITAAYDIRIRIPAGFNMSWDTSDLSAVILGTAAGKVSSTVSYEDGGKTLVIDVLTDFAPNDIITVSGLSFRNFTAASPDDNLELEVRNDGAVSAEDDKVVFIVFIAVTPNLSSADDQSFTVGDPVTEMIALRVTDDPFPQITAANDIRIRIPAGLSMIWDTTNVSPTLSGRARSKVSTTVSYEDGGKTLVINVLTDFAADDWLNVKGLSFMNFTSASFARRLELEVYNDGVANTSDTRTKTIFGPTYDVAVVPDTQTASRLPSNGTNYTVDFTVANIGSNTDDYDLLTTKIPGGTITVVSITGPGVTQGANPDSARLANLGMGLTATVTVTYAVASVPAGTTDTLVLTARSVGAPSKTDDARLELVVVRPNLAIGKTVNPVGTPPPGTDLTYTITVTNAGSDSAMSVVHVDSLPTQVGFKFGSVSTSLPPGVTATVAYSNDGGSSWTYTPLDAGCGAPAGYDDCVTHIRWSLQNPLSHLAPDNSGQFEFVARIR